MDRQAGDDRDTIISKSTQQLDDLRGVILGQTGDGIGDERKNTERRHVHDDVNQPDHQFIQSIEQGQNRRCFLG